MPTVWTDETYLPTVYTDETPPTTDYIQLEPTGAGFAPFGDPTSKEFKALSIHSRGFGDPSTKYIGITG